ncbi:hypothetical protein [Methylorubrum extorquens]|uniref:hypothetical protein n=1 Tax=Methylorubrum extorquens TaxID=408 RepID=UPI002238F83F|nr:hypothetical protein [Methylorubrum extorquens]UYW34469.1 hypothetical protein OKB92_10425 [Methylorubrum extorquens]
MAGDFYGADWQANLSRWAQMQLGGAMGLPAGPQVPFYRMGEPVIIPVSPDSAGNPFEVRPPPDATCFQYTNNNPFAVRLCGTREGQDFVAVTAHTGWLWMPATQGIRTTLKPILLSAMSVDGPYAATAPEQKAGVGFLELQYGTGAPG